MNTPTKQSRLETEAKILNVVFLAIVIVAINLYCSYLILEERLPIVSDEIASAVASEVLEHTVKQIEANGCMPIYLEK